MSRLLELHDFFVRIPQSVNHRVRSFVVASAPFAFVANDLNVVARSPISLVCAQGQEHITGLGHFDGSVLFIVVPGLSPLTPMWENC